MSTEQRVIDIVTNKNAGPRRENPQEKVASSPSKPDYECETCSLRLESTGHLKAHMMQAHEKTESFKCEECNFETFSDDELRKHSDEMVHSIIGDEERSAAIMKYMHVEKYVKQKQP